MIYPAIIRLGLAVAVAAGLRCAAAETREERLSTDYVTREWHASDGLPSEQISRIAQDQAGFLWIATTDGVVRFDGSHFQKYRLSADPGAKVRVMTWSSRIGLVAAIATGGAEALHAGAFRPWRTTEYQGRRIVTMFSEPGTGVLWLACDDGTVLRDDGEAVQSFGPKQGLPHSGPWTFATDGSGRVWVSIDSFVARYEAGTWSAQSGAADGSELRLASSAQNGPWVISENRVWKFDGDRCVPVAGLPSRVGGHYVQAAIEDRNGVLWIATRSQGLYSLTAGVLERVATSYEEIYAVFEDREGNIWAGTNGGGLNRIRRKSYRLYDKTAGLLDNFSYTVCADARGDVWVANRDGGVVRMHGDKVERFVGRPGWPTFNAMSIFPRAGGGVGVTTGIGIYFVSEDEPVSIRRIEALRNTLIRVSFTAKNGDLWFALDPDRVARLRGKTAEIFDRERGMEGHEIRAIAEDREGNIWVGGTDGNLFRFKDTRFERVPLAGVETGAIQAIRLEDDGRAWIGTVNAGVVVWAEGKISTCDTRHGLPDNDITQIVPDDQGFLWLGSKHGIFRVSRQEINEVVAGTRARVVPRVIGPDDGLKDVACLGLFQPGACKGPDGTLWFATRRGMLALDPSRQFAAQTPPKVAIEEVTRDGQPVLPAKLLKVDAQFQKLELRFGVLCLSSPESVQAAYRLDGFDEDWVEAPANHRAIYPRLRPGSYRFRVKANLGEGGGAAASSAELSFVIIPSWWQTDEFRITIFLVAALGVIVTVRAWTNRRLAQQAERLERDSAIRTRIAQNIHDDLGANLTQISLLTQAARQNPSASAKNFEQIHATVSAITRSMDEVVWAVNPKFDDVESLAGYLGDFARDFLSVAGIRCRLGLPEKLPTLMLASQVRHHAFLCCKEALHNVVKHAHATEVTIAMAVEGTRLTVIIEDNGRGVQAAASEARPADRTATGNGLENMRRRMAEIGGTFSIGPGANGGTRIVFSVECRPVSP